MKLCDTDLNVRGRLLRTAELDSNSYESLENPHAVLDELRHSGIGADLFTFEQIMPDVTPQHPYFFEWATLAVLPITTFDRWLKEQIGVKTRNKVRKAEKSGVTTCEMPFDDRLIHGIWEIYNEIPIRQGRRFRHYGDDMETVRRISATFLPSSVFIGAFAGERLIGFAKLTLDKKGQQAGIMHILSRAGDRDKSPTNALMAQAVRSCAERGVSYLVYSRLTYGKKLRDGLSDFKERNGFSGVRVPHYYVPLTRLGALALQCGLQHGFRDRIPEAILGNFRKLRDNWYSHRYLSAGETSGRP